MIQPNELRIGNLVNTIYGITTIIGVVDNGLEDYAMFIRTDSGHLHRTDGPDATPIPLTEEWLMKAGFVVVANYHPEGKTYRNGDFDIMEFYPYLSYKGERIAEVKSVHHLQNLYFALTGQELNIEI